MTDNTKAKRGFRYAVMISDSILFSVLLFLPLNPFFHIAKHPILSVVVLIGICGIVLAVRINYLGLSKQRRLKANLRQEQIDRLLLMSDESLSKIFGKERFILIRKQNPDRFDILEAIRKGADAIGLLSNQFAFRDLIKAYAPKTSVYNADEILYSAEAGHMRNDLPKYDPSAKKRFRLNKYCLVGIVLFCISFILRYKIYYRMISCLCLFFASISGAFGDSFARRKLDDIS